MAVALTQPLAIRTNQWVTSRADTNYLAWAADALVPTAHAAGPAAESGTTKWTCPMHPHYIAEVPGTCPICGMDLVKLKTDSDPPKQGRSSITVPPEVVQSMGIRLAPAERSRFGRRVRSFGIVQANERLQTDMTARVEGWVESLSVSAVGDEVAKGEVLFELYSPQLIVSQNDYLRSRNTRTDVNRGLTQLKSFGVQAKALDQIRTLKRPMEHVPFYADRKGTIAELNLRLGTYVKRGMMLARIQDYSSVWLMVSVAEKDLGFIERETPARVTFPNLPGRHVNATVDYVYPTIDHATRTGKVRVVVNNPEGLFRPGSYADVEFEVASSHRIAVPSEAILTNGDGRFVVVSLGEGRFEPRSIATGLVSGRWTEVTRGIEAGDSIVVSGQFLLDSESALRESFRKMERLQLPLPKLQLDDGQLAHVDHLVDAALYLHETLVQKQDFEPAYLNAAISVRDKLWPAFKGTKLAFVLSESASALVEVQNAATVGERREGLAQVMVALRPWLLEGAPARYRDKKLVVFKEVEGGRLWVQMAGPASNPYGEGVGHRVPWHDSGPEKIAMPGTEIPTALDERQEELTEARFSDRHREDEAARMHGAANGP